MLRISRIFLILSLAALYSCAGSGTTAQNKEKARSLERLGSSLFRDGKTREALAQLLEAEKLDSSNPELLHELALVYQRLSEYDLSLGYFKKALSLKPDFPDAYNNMGILYSQKKEWQKAIESFDKAASNLLYRTPHFAYHNKGLVYYQIKDYDKAVEAQKKAISLSPTYVDAYIDLANAYKMLGKNDSAIAAYEKIITLVPESLIPYLAMARLYEKNGQTDMAMDKLKYIINADPRSPEAKDAIKLMKDIQSR